MKLASWFSATLIVISCSHYQTTARADFSQTAAADAHVYALRSNACESIRITLLACSPSPGDDRGALCKKAQSRLLPTAFDDLRTSVVDSEAKFNLIEAFRQQTEKRMDQILAMPQTDDARIAAKPIITTSRTECFNLLDELE